MSARIRFSWSRVTAVFLKELVQMRRDRLTFAILLAMPVVQLLLFGYAINTDPRHMPTVIEAREDGPMTRAITLRTGSDEREPNMRAFAAAALGLLEDSLEALG